MKQLLFGFYGEGATDYKFLMPLMERILQYILPHVDIFSIDVRVDESDLTQVEKMMAVAEKTNGFGLVIFHLDADAPDTTRAYTDRFEPGFLEILACKDGVNKDIVPLIPVRMTEAWIFVDFEAFRVVVGTHERADALGFPQRPREVELMQRPKETLTDAVQRAVGGRKHRKKIKPDDVYKPLADRLDLNLLAQVPAFREFEERLKNMLRNLHYLEDE